MSTNFPGGTFAYQKVAPSDDAAVRRVLGDGILNGCHLSYSGRTLTMSPGRLLLCGRVVKHGQEQHWSVGESQGYARLFITLDLSQSATETTFEQVSAELEYGYTLDEFWPLNQDDINDDGTVYQVVVCTVALGANGINGIVYSLPRLTGTVKNATITSMAQLDSLMDSGTYPLSITSGGASAGNVTFSSAIVTVEAFDELTVRQTISRLDRPVRAIRTGGGGAWAPWSIENPPMALGVEYRTTELWQNKPVYVKQIAYDSKSFNDGHTKIAHGISGLATCIEAKAFWYRDNEGTPGWRFLPESYPGDTAYDGQIDYVDSEGVDFRLGYTTLLRISESSGPLYVTLKYTKT